jgi:hypothetical protein
MMIHESQHVTFKEVTINKHSLLITDEKLAQYWTVQSSVAHDTLKVTTQTFILNVVPPIERRCRSKNVMLKCNRLQCKMYSDTFFSNQPSLLGNKCRQLLFVTDFG